VRAIHPLGKSPVITDGGNTLAESGAIAEYLIDTYGDGRLIPPPKTPERLALYHTGCIMRRAPRCRRCY